MLIKWRDEASEISENGSKCRYSYCMFPWLQSNVFYGFVSEWQEWCSSEALEKTGASKSGCLSLQNNGGKGYKLICGIAFYSIQCLQKDKE